MKSTLAALTQLCMLESGEKSATHSGQTSFCAIYGAADAKKARISTQFMLFHSVVGQKKQQAKNKKLLCQNAVN
jgi:hypothetical protein